MVAPTPPVNGPDIGIKDAFGNLVTAAKDPNNQDRIKKGALELASDAKSMAKKGLASLTAYVNGTAAPETPKPAAETTPAAGTDPATPPVTVTPAPGTTASTDDSDTTSEEDDTEADDDENTGDEKGKKKKKKQPAEEGSLIADVMMKIMPDGVKDWAATMTIPLAAQGKNLIRQFGKAPKVSNSPMAYLNCLSGDKITEIPNGVYSYAQKLLKMLGIEDKDSDGDKRGDIAMSISVGFISFLRKHLAGIIPGVQCFNDAATTGPTGTSALIDFGANPKTLLSLLKLAPSSEIVDPDLLNSYKQILGGNIETMFKDQPAAKIDINSYFGDGLNYGQFVEGYAKLGRDMAQAGKWAVDPKRITEDMTAAANDVLIKYGITDPDGSLAIGLATASVYGADIAKAAVADPKPADKPAAAPAPAAPPKTK